MITKIQTISFGPKALAYCERGGDLLTSNYCFGKAKEISEQMEHANKRNYRCSKKYFHIKIRMAPEDKGLLSTQDWIDISDKYAKKLCFENNLYAVYIHEENTENEHIHIVAARIREDNLAVPDKFSHIRSLDFSREIEKEYELRKVKRKLESLKQNEVFKTDNQHEKEMRIAIFQALKYSDHIKQFEMHLKQYNLKIKIGRGIVFTNSAGVSRKGSAIDRKLSLSKIRKVLEDNQPINSTIKTNAIITKQNQSRMKRGPGLSM